MKILKNIFATLIMVLMFGTVSNAQIVETDTLVTITPDGGVDIFSVLYDYSDVQYKYDGVSKTYSELNNNNTGPFGAPNSLTILSSNTNANGTLEIDFSYLKSDTTAIYEIDSIIFRLNDNNLFQYINTNSVNGIISFIGESKLTFVPETNLEVDSIKIYRHIVGYVNINPVNDDISNKYNVFVYDNVLNVKTTEFNDYIVEIYNMNGQLVFTEIASMDNQFYLNDYESGIYIVKVKDNETGKTTFNKININ